VRVCDCVCVIVFVSVCVFGDDMFSFRWCR